MTNVIPRIEGMIEAFEETLKEVDSYTYDSMDDRHESDYYVNQILSKIRGTIKTKTKRLKEALEILKGDDKEQ